MVEYPGIAVHDFTYLGAMYSSYLAMIFSTTGVSSTVMMFFRFVRTARAVGYRYPDFGSHFLGDVPIQSVGSRKEFSR